MDEAMKWFERLLWPREAISNIEADVAFLRLQSSVTNSKLDDLKERMIQMAANFDQLVADLNTLAQGYVALQAANKQLSDALASADADKAAAVAQAIAEDDAVDQAAVDAADAIAQGVLNPPAPAAE
jgi:regulator of PEP synthase PpsR (kinase-PPPase family)